MNPLYAAILRGNPPQHTNVGKSGSPFVFANATDIDLDVMLVARNQHHGAMQLNRLDSVKAGGRGKPLEIAVPTEIAAFASATGAFVAAVTLGTAAEVKFHCDMIARPNDIGAPPAPSERGPIPLNSARVLVACARTASGATLIREQFWRRTADSYSLAPKETRITSFRVATGVERTSSRQEDVSASLGLSAGISWGPISASVSASLNSTSSTLQSVSLFNHQSVSTTDTVTNNDPHRDMTVLQWQLVDVINIFRDGRLAASVMSGQLPTLTRTHLARAA